MYTGETQEEFFARRQPLADLWNGFMAGATSVQFPAEPPAMEQELDDEGDWICEHTHPELWAEGRALVQAIHDRKNTERNDHGQTNV